MRRSLWRGAAIAGVMVGLWTPGLSQGAVRVKVALGGDSKHLKTLTAAYNQAQDQTQVESVEVPTLETDLLEGRLEADLVMLNGAGSLDARGLAQLEPIDSPRLMREVPAHLRDSEFRWVAYAKRWRILYYRADRVDPIRDELRTYGDLAHPRWKGRLCFRHADKEYNQSFVASLLALKGRAETEALLRAWMGNEPHFTEADMGKSVLDPTEGAKGVLTALHTGRCDVGVANTYYFGHFLKTNGFDRLGAGATPVRALIPDQGESATGVHVNVQALGLVKGSKKLAAQAFVEWLLQAPQQHWYADLSYFHPVLTDASAIPSFLTSLFGGPVRENQAFALSQAGDLREEALSLMRAVGWKTLSEIKKP